MKWYVVATKPNGERLAEANLRQQGFVPYLPQMMTTRRHARRVEQVKRPLFPGYLFVQLDADTARWRSINGTFGVRHILTNNGQPQALNDGFVEALIKLEENGVIGAVAMQFVVGEEVRIIAGPFAEKIGQIMTTDQSGRVRLMLNLMGGDVVSTVAADKVEKVS